MMFGSKVMKVIFTTFVLILISLPSFAQKLTLAVAANAQYAIKELVAEYQKENKVGIEIITGSSGKLTNQIMQGAPFHIFFSADMDYPIELADKGFSSGRPRTYAYGRIILWTSKNNIILSKDLKNIAWKDMRRVAIANPNLAPYGKETLKILKSIGIYESIKKKIIKGESVSQVNQYITTGNVDLGFTSKSIVFAPELKNVGKWVDIDQKYYSPIEQGVLILKRGKEEAGVQVDKFIDFVFSAKGQAIFIKNGYKNSKK